MNFSSPCLREELLCKTSEPVRDCCHKVTIVGAGMVGVAIANSLLFQVLQSFSYLFEFSPLAIYITFISLFRIELKIRTIEYLFEEV